MAQDPGPNAPKYDTDFTCRFCGEKKPFFYDWQRCYDCVQQAGSKDFRLIPSVCQACCKKNHMAPLSSK